MKFDDAVEATHDVYAGVAARIIKRQDSRARTWFIVVIRGHRFLVCPDRTKYLRVRRRFVDYFDDWEPQTAEEARRETKFMNSEDGLRLRNALLGFVFEPQPENVEAPDYLPEDINQGVQ